MNYVKHLLINFLIVGEIVRSQSQYNPCPDLIEFKSLGQETFAVITIPPPGKGITIMNVTIEVFGASKGKPSLHLAKSLDDTADDAEKGLDIQYIYNFPRANQFPRIIQILLNKREICSASAETSPGIGARTTWPTSRTIYIPTDATELSYIPYHLIGLNRKPDNTQTSMFTPPKRGEQSDKTWLQALSTADVCGKISKAEVLTHLIINGAKVASGEFPWIVAMYKDGFGTGNYICGGSLISNKYILTAAHCTINRQQVYLELGRHNISNPNEVGFVQRESLSIFHAPGYTAAPADDIALILVRRIDFTNKIKPICLWTQRKNKDDSILHGQVTGWGITENGDQNSIATVPMKVGVKTTSPDRCRNAHELYKDINTEKSFCAGGEKAGPCSGDSGGGLYINDGNIWYLRGIVSVSVGEYYTSCNLETYAIYTDVSYYLNWLETYLS